MNLINLTIEKVVIHGVPNPSSKREPILSPTLITLAPDSTSELARRITEVLGRGSNSVEMSIADTTEASTSAIVSKIIENPEDENFLTKTQSLAQKLYQAQNRPFIKGGILVCLYGKTGEQQQQYVALIKAESQNGFVLSDNNSLKLLDEIFLTNSQKLYKIGFCLYVTGETGETPVVPDNLTFFVFDHLMVKATGEGMTQFFSTTFLGCKALVTSATQTKTFYETTIKFIENNPLLSSADKVGKANALHVYLKENQQTTIRASEFADSFFDTPELKDQYLSLINNTEGLSGDRAITKDISKISNHLKVRNVKFTSNVKVSFPSNTDRDSIFKVDKFDPIEGFTHVRIKGEVK